MNRRLLLGALLVVASLPLAGLAHADQPDTVILANGGKLRGTVIESDPKGATTIRLLDSTTRILKRSEVARIEYAEQTPAPAAAPTPPAALPPTAPPVALAPVHYARPRSDADGEAVPEGHHVELRSNKGLWVTGLVLDLGLWAVRAGLTASICSSYSSDARGCNGQDIGGAATPVIGAWIQASKGTGGDNGVTPTAFAALVGCGVGETIAFGFFVAGLAAHHRVVVDGEEQAALKIGPVRFLPSVGAKTVGAVGTF